MCNFTLNWYKSSQGGEILPVWTVSNHSK